MDKTPFQLARENKLKNQRSKVIKTRSRTTETADKPTTVFDANHTGYNSIEALTKCTVCNAQAVPGFIDTIDGRLIPMNYCLRHRTCLPTGVNK